jgi:hypothetical protein
MRTVVRAAVAFAALLLASSSTHAATIKLATLNLNNLHHVLGEYRDRLGADVIALQEVNGPKAAALVFPPDQYARGAPSGHCPIAVTVELGGAADGD